MQKLPITELDSDQKICFIHVYLTKNAVKETYGALINTIPRSNRHDIEDMTDFTKSLPDYTSLTILPIHQKSFEEIMNKIMILRERFGHTKLCILWDIQHAKTELINNLNEDDTDTAFDDNKIAEVEAFLQSLKTASQIWKKIKELDIYTIRIQKDNTEQTLWQDMYDYLQLAKHRQLLNWDELFYKMLYIDQNMEFSPIKIMQRIQVKNDIYPDIQTNCYDNNDALDEYCNYMLEAAAISDTQKSNWIKCYKPAWKAYILEQIKYNSHVPTKQAVNDEHRFLPSKNELHSFGNYIDPNSNIFYVKPNATFVQNITSEHKDFLNAFLNIFGEVPVQKRNFIRFLKSCIAPSTEEIGTVVYLKHNETTQTEYQTLMKVITELCHVLPNDKALDPKYTVINVTNTSKETFPFTRDKIRTYKQKACNQIILINDAECKTDYDIRFQLYPVKNQYRLLAKLTQEHLDELLTILERENEYYLGISSIEY